VCPVRLTVSPLARNRATGLPRRLRPPFAAFPGLAPRGVTPDPCRAETVAGAGGDGSGCYLRAGLLDCEARGEGRPPGRFPRHGVVADGPGIDAVPEL
jgi:hypothetical protein